VFGRRQENRRKGTTTVDKTVPTLRAVDEDEAPEMPAELRVALADSADLAREGLLARNVTRWRDGKMVKRWVAAGMLNAEASFRRVKGCKDMPVLVDALARHAGAATEAIPVRSA